MEGHRKTWGDGCHVSEVSWPLYHYHMSIANTIQMAEASAYHSRLIREHGSKLHPLVRLRLEAGVFISATDYIQAQRARALFYRQSHDLLGNVRSPCRPNLPVTAFEIGSQTYPYRG